jgi:hypothetical protein
MEGGEISKQIEVGFAGYKEGVLALKHGTAAWRSKSYHRAGKKYILAEIAAAARDPYLLG